ncbi:MAG: NAD(+)/NADH kinase [Actinomycetota bacterium]
MSAVALVLHPGRPEAAVLADEVTVVLESGGHEVRFTETDAARCSRPDLGRPEPALVDGLDLAVSLGGDGTMLWTVELVAPAGVPVLGVNLGSLGYLTEVEPHGALAAIKRCLLGEGEIEERLLLAAEVVRPGADPRPLRLSMNEIVVEKAPLGQIVGLAVAFDGRPFTTYAADGLIVATPTGSTAYSLSARGPIVDPTHRALLMTPVAPHMLFDRSLVLSPDTVIEIEVLDRRAIVASDGHLVEELTRGDVVRCRAADVPARMVRLGDRDFHEILKTKFGLEDR